jgi:DNA-directed RNA polymerase specialized sigma24 family protein
LEAKTAVACVLSRLMSEPVSTTDSRPARYDFAGFYRATVVPLRRYLARLTGNRTEAQDLAHDAYARSNRASS